VRVVAHMHLQLGCRIRNNAGVLKAQGTRTHSPAAAAAAAAAIMQLPLLYHRPDLKGPSASLVCTRLTKQLGCEELCGPAGPLLCGAAVAAGAVEATHADTHLARRF